MNKNWQTVLLILILCVWCLKAVVDSNHHRALIDKCNAETERADKLDSTLKAQDRYYRNVLQIHKTASVGDTVTYVIQ